MKQKMLNENTNACLGNRWLFLVILLLITLRKEVEADDICNVCDCRYYLVSCTNKPDLRFDSLPHTIEHIRIYYSNLSELHNILTPTSVQDIHIVGCSIGKVTDESFKSFSDLETLQISNSSIQELPQKLLYNNIHLNGIDLSGSRINVIPTDFFSQVKKLRSVFLKQTEVEEIPEGTFRSNRKIKILNVSCNRIKNLQPGTFQIDKVDNFDSLLSNVTVDISNNLLSSVQNNVFSLCPQVTHLNLSRNHIDRLYNKSFDGLVSLRVLDLSNNKLRELNGSNLLTEVDSAFATQLHKLVYLNVKRNQISRILRDAFRCCPALETLDLSENTISQIKNGAFFHNIRLQQLLLEQNSITTLNCASFFNLLSLETLNLDGNTLSVFKLSYFSPLQNLKTLIVQLDQNSKCECSIFVKMLQRGVQIRIDHHLLSDQCNFYYEELKSGDFHLKKECGFEDCQWNPSDPESPDPHILTERPVTSPVVTHDTHRRKDELSEEDSQGNSAPTTARSPKELRDNRTAHDSSVQLLTSEELENTASSNNGDNATSNSTGTTARVSGLTTSQMAFSLAGGIAAGVVCGGLLCVVRRVRKSCEHVYEEIDDPPRPSTGGQVCVPLRPIAERGAEVVPPDLPPRVFDADKVTDEEECTSPQTYVQRDSQLYLPLK